jgi:hypothetical protein
MKRNDPRRTAGEILVWLGSALLMVGCGGTATPEPEAPQAAPAPEPAPASEAADADDESFAEGEARAAPAGAAPPASRDMLRAEQLDAKEWNIEGLTEALDRTLALATPDCATGAVLRDQICDLSAAICRLSGERREDAELRARCTDAQNRCDRADHRVRAACPPAR